MADSPVTHPYLLFLQSLAIHGLFFAALWFFTAAQLRQMTDNHGAPTSIEIALTSPPVATALATAPALQNKTATRNIHQTEARSVAINASPPLPVESTGNPSATAIQNSFTLELKQALEQGKEYPALARARHETGEVEIEFILKKNGELVGARISKACRYEKLNSAALLTVTRLARFKPVPDEISKGDWKVIVPLDFRIE